MHLITLLFAFLAAQPAGLLYRCLMSGCRQTVFFQIITRFTPPTVLVWFLRKLAHNFLRAHTEKTWNRFSKFRFKKFFGEFFKFRIETYSVEQIGLQNASSGELSRPTGLPLVSLVFFEFQVTFSKCFLDFVLLY